MKFPPIEVVRDRKDPNLLHVYYEDKETMRAIRAMVELLRRETNRKKRRR